ncbi:hypothetical protein FRC09_003153 [Ceratobasidium sp. 395]|nr:hypothetical protein FRC09_003153 [Ceratobasidium sp. 395]
MPGTGGWGASRYEKLAFAPSGSDPGAWSGGSEGDEYDRRDGRRFPRRGQGRIGLVGPAPKTGVRDKTPRSQALNVRTNTARLATTPRGSTPTPNPTLIKAPIYLPIAVARGYAGWGVCLRVQTTGASRIYAEPSAMPTWDERGTGGGPSVRVILRALCTRRVGWECDEDGGAERLRNRQGLQRTGALSRGSSLDVGVGVGVADSLAPGAGSAVDSANAVATAAL